jgi:hypothetical protein
MLPPLASPVAPPTPPIDTVNLWVIAARPDGARYYYHFRTRETTYHRPGGGATVVTHEELEARAARGYLIDLRVG